MPSAERSFRGVFDEVAELYDKARPDYPEEMFEDISELARLVPGSDVLEIGCGTGQATLPLARAGYHVVAVELGANLASIARRKLSSYPSVRVDVSPFEDWTTGGAQFDLAISATAFHWIDPMVRLQRVADALRPGGSFAWVDTRHVLGGTVDFFDFAQECYQRWDPSVPLNHRLKPVEDLPTDSREIDDSGLFTHVELRRYVRDIDYSADEYVEVLSTYSGQRHLPDSHRFALYDDIRDLINHEFGGHITKTYLTELRLASKRN